MNRAGTPIATLLLIVLVPVHSSICNGQEKLASFLDPDETNAHRALVVDALKQICPQGQILLGKQGNAAGCRYCPRQTTEWDAKDLSWDLKRAFIGHFTSTDQEGIGLSGRGCEPHSANFGGTFVFALEGSVVKLLSYNGALITERCHKFQVLGSPDMLVCTDDWGAQVTLWSYVYMVRFGEDGESKVNHIFETVDKSSQACGIDFFDDSPTTVQKSQITALELVNSRGKPPTLLITATLGERDPTDEERKACQQGKPIPLKLKSYRLKFFFNGSTFRPSAESEKALKLFPKAESPRNSYSPNH